MHRKEVCPLVKGAARRLLILTMLAFLASTTLHAQLWNMPPTNLASWADLDNAVSNTYAGFTSQIEIFPPGPYQFGIGGSYITFSPNGDLAALTNLCPSNMQFGVPVWQVSVVEIPTPSEWLYLGTNGVAFHTNQCPSSYNPTQWVQSAYGYSAPSYLVGTNVDLWYSERSRCRFNLGLMLVKSNDWPVFQAAQHAAATNAPPLGTWAPSIPSDTNSLSFLNELYSANTMNLWVYSPSSRPVAVITNSTLAASQANAWTVAGNFNAVSPFNNWQIPSQFQANFVRAGYTDVNKNGDGIPDFIKLFVFGMDTNNMSTTIDGYSNYYAIYILGLNPNISETTYPAATLTSPSNNYQQMWVP